MQKIIRSSFSTIAIISGAARYDPLAHSIANKLKALSPQVNITGVVGSAGNSSFSNTYASSDILDNNQFEVTRPYNNYDQLIQDSFLMPYRSYTHYCNYKLVKQLSNKGFFQDLRASKLQAVLTVGNFSLAKRIGDKMNKVCEEAKKVKPYTALFHRQRSERIIDNEQYFDYQYYNVQKALWNPEKYIFPSMCIGYEGLYQAFQHLQKYKSDSSNDSFLLEPFSYEVSELVKKARNDYRSEKGISEDSYIFYLNAGINKKEIDFSFKSFKGGFKNFLKRSSVNNVSSEFFEIFVEIPEGSAADIVKNKLGYLPSNIKVTQVEQKDKYGAMSAADFGMLHNGDATVEAAALQLPALVVDSMSNAHTYFNNLYNGHASPLNVATNYQGYEDLCGSLTCTEERIGYNMERHFKTPKIRFYYAKLYRQQIQKILSRNDQNPQLKVGESGFEVGCKHILEKSEAFAKMRNQNFDWKNPRKALL